MHVIVVCDVFAFIVDRASCVMPQLYIVPFLNTISGFEVVPKIVFGWQFVACKNLGNTRIVIDA